MKFYLGLLLFLPLLFVSCGDDDDENQTATFNVTIENVATPTSFFQSGLASIPVGSADAGPILPGGSYEITFNAGSNVTPGDGGTRLSFLTMFVQSNDLFLAPGVAGIALYDADGQPIGAGTPADVTDQVSLWDAGTEVNEVSGGSNQKPQQAPTAMDQGVDENGVITLIENDTDGTNDLPAVDEVIRVMVTYLESDNFSVTFENVSDAMTMALPALGTNVRGPVPMSPFVWAVHTSDAPFFTPGEVASTTVEDIAEDGEAGVGVAFVTDNTGLIVPLSPGVWAVHDEDDEPLFDIDDADRGDGLEGIAEDGTPGDLAAVLASDDDVSASGIFNTPVGATGAGPIGPGGSYSFSFTANSGDNLSFATMFIQSNDWFYSFGENGIPLFDDNGAVTGDVTSSVGLYDSGTEADEYPGAGRNQVIRQGALNNGAADSDNTVRIATLTDNVPANASVIRVTITAQ